MKRSNLNNPPTRSEKRIVRKVEYDLEPVTITLQRQEWQLVADYFEGDVEAMGDNAPRSQQKRARKALEWIKTRIGNPPNTEISREAGK